MRSKTQPDLNVVKGILSDITYASKATANAKEATTDADISALVQRAIKRRQESITQYKAGGRTDLVETEEKEVVVLQRYLPEQMSEEEIELEVRRVVEVVGAKDQKDLGKVMKKWSVDGARAPRKAVTDVVKRFNADAIEIKI
ncbi:Yqey-like protein-domain-containing protein [Jimgerdemannia flammicorona]|uniref:Altered inheritance of mitochondria protein 41 n=1 Tax=Jimgerdemannia flammicorona TaxID=994334 RepID=A0A433QRM2_9FUNG|nr:Yqey-like protein-domain-containing protein [Jimgerdemannia flammicorona]